MNQKIFSLSPLNRILKATLIAGLLLVTFLPFNASSATGSQQDPDESSATLSGVFVILRGDPHPESALEPKTEYILHRADGSAASLQVGEALAAPFGGFPSLDRRAVLVQGRWKKAREAGRASLFEVDSIDLLEEPDSALAGASLAAVTGPQPWISLLCKFADIRDEPNPPSYFRDMYRGTYPGLDHYWREQSYDSINLLGSGAIGWVTLPHPKSYYVPSYADLGLLASECAAAADPFVYFPSYAGINFMFNSTLDCCAWGGGWYATLDGVFQLWRTTWEPPWGYQNVAVMDHEMGHGFGLPHSSGMYGQVYDNPWDVMSSWFINCPPFIDPTFGCVGQHTIAAYKDVLGWIPANQKFTATPGNTPAKLALERTALPQTGNYKMVILPIRNSTTHYYTLEARKFAGYDAKLPGQAVIIHEVINGYAYLIDADNNGNNADAGAMWTVGETFIDSPNRVRVTVNAETPSGFVVTIRRR